MINAKEVLQAQLARGLGLDRYAEIMHVDPSSLSFQRLFNGYYRVRRNEEWRRYYYRLFIAILGVFILIYNQDLLKALGWLFGFVLVQDSLFTLLNALLFARRSNRC